MSSRLNIAGQDVGFFHQLPISTNFAISDVSDIGSIDADHTKTISIPGTSVTNKIFEFIFEVNINLQTFNPNLSVPASYYSNEILVFSGRLQLISITTVNKRVTYNCTIQANNGDLFLLMGGSFLADIDMSDLNHTLNYTNFSTTPTAGVGYVYAYIDYGVDGLNDWNWDVSKMKAGIYELEWVNRIFAASFKTFTSTFLNGPYYKSIFIPSNTPGAYQLNPTQIVNKTFYANKTATQTCTFNFTVVGPSGLLAANEEQFVMNGVSPVVFQDETTPPFNDAGGVYNNGTGIYTTASATPTTITFVLSFTGTINNVAAGIVTGVPVDFLVTNSVIVIRIVKNGIFIVSSFTLNLAAAVYPVIPGNKIDIPGNINVSYTDNNPVAGDTYQASVGVCTVTGFFRDNTSSNLSPTGSATMAIVLNTGSTFYNSLPTNNAAFGDTIDMNLNCRPQNVTQLDFITSIFKAHNLYCEQDKNDPNNFIIEPRDSFIIRAAATAKRWHKKWDDKKEVTITPMGALDNKVYEFKYSPDEDYYNKKYQTNYADETYGQQKTIVQNEFIKETKTIQLVFSASPGVAYHSDIVAPRFMSIEGPYPGTGGTPDVKPIQVNIRRLFYGGIKNCQSHNLITSASGPVSMTTYIYCGMIDDPITPSYDLCFAPTKEFYWVLPGQTWTLSNLFNMFWKKQIDEITDPNSKIVRASLLFTESDIVNFSFRYVVALMHSYFTVNKIIDYDPQVKQSIIVELLKLKEGAVFSAGSNYDPHNPPGNNNRSMATLPELNGSGNYGSSRGAMVGQRLNNGAATGLVVGNDVNVDWGMLDFSGIGLTNQSIGPEFDGQVMLRNNAFRVSDNGQELVKLASIAYTASFTVTKPKSLVDATAGNIDVLLPDPALNLEVIVVRTDTTISVVAATSVGGSDIRTLGTSAATDVIPGYTTRKYTSDGTNYYY